MPIAAKLYYFVHNEGAASQPPVLLLHGAGGDHLHWPPQVRRLDYGRIYALDLPGHGTSGLLGCQRIEDYVQAVLYFMDELKLFQAVLVGHSMGGAIALQMALSHPQRVLGLGIVSSGAHLPVSPKLLDALSREETMPGAVEMIMQWAFSPSADANLRRLALRRMRQVRSTVLHGDFLACNDWDIRAQLDKIHCPTLILAGSADKMTPLRYAEFLHQALPQSALQVFPESGHMLMLERPQEVASALTDWLKTLSFQPGRLY